jgi:perosamine synthetase
MKKNLAIIGSSGNLGNYFVQYISNEGYKQLSDYKNIYFVSRKNKNTCENHSNLKIHYINFNHLKKNKKIDYIIYLNSPSNTKKYNKLNNRKFLSNLKDNLFFFQKNYPKAKFLYFSSGAIYGEKFNCLENSKINFFKEKKNLERYYYSLNKFNTENYIKKFSKENSFRSIILRGYSFFGPTNIKTNFNYFVVNDFINQALKTNKINIKNPLCKKVYRSFLCYDDLVINVLNLLKKNFKNTETFNFGSDNKISLYSLAKKIVKITGATIKTPSNNKIINENDKMNYFPKLRKIRNKITFFQNDLDKSLNKVINLEKLKISNQSKIKRFKKLILTSGPMITSREKNHVLNCVKNGWGENKNLYSDKVMDSFKKFFNVKYVLPCSSATGALHISLEAMGIGKGDEVIVPSISWIAAARAVTLCGAKPVFVDISTDDLNINPKKIQSKITRKTAAVIIVHMYGYSCDLDQITKICKKNNLKLIEDSAPAIGSTYKNKFLGTYGDVGVFSFQGAKLVTAGEGGMLLTNKKEIYEKSLTISNFGIFSNEIKYYWVRNNGLKYKMSNIQQAMIYAQLKNLKHMLKRKNEINKVYNKYIFNNSNIHLIKFNKFCKPNHWMNTLIIKNDKFNNKSLIDHLKYNNIDTRPIFPLVTSYPIWKKLKINLNEKDLNISKFLSNKAINLPSGFDLDEKKIKKISLIINKFIFQNKLHI